MNFPLRILLTLGVVLAAKPSIAADDPSPLDQPIGELRFERAPIVDALRILSRAYQANIVPEPDLKVEVSADLNGGTLRDALSILTEPHGLFFEERSGAVVVRRRKTVLYPINYLQLTRNGSGSASITLGTTNGAGTGQYPGALAQQQLLQAMGGATDATQISISQENQNTFWTGLDGELKAMLGDGDRLILNRFSGIAQVTAPVDTHRMIGAFLDVVNRRISQQVEIEARLVEVTLRDEQKLGIDWELATRSFGDISIGGEAPLDIPGVGGAVLSAGTFTTALGFSRATAVIHALSQQGEVRTVAQPRIRALNNQSAFIKIGEDRPFFRLSQSTTFQQAGTQVPVNQTQEQFSVSTITIGTILAVTPQVNDEGVITLDVLPAITRLQSIVTSPDGRQTAPATEVKQASTIVRLRDGETAMIGGLISEENGEVERAVPGLASLPGLGRAFRSKASLRVRTELVIFLTPRLVRN